MDEPNFSSNVTIMLLLIVCFIFVSIDGLELYRLSDQWEYALSSLNPTTFEECIKYPMLARTGFTIFSFLAAFSSFLISLLLVINPEFFIEKLCRAYVQMIYVLFGPYMLGVGLIGLFYWDKILYHCESEKLSKIFSFSNLFNLTACLALALVITVGVIIYESVITYINSILQRGEGNHIIRKIFWWVVVKYRNPSVNN